MFAEPVNGADVLAAGRRREGNPPTEYRVIQRVKRGHAQKEAVWLVLLEMANGDPLRAMEIEEKITERWWLYWEAWREYKNRKEKDRHRKR